MSQQRLRLRIASEADVTRSLLETTRMARELGFAAVSAQALSTAVSELVRNILKYAGSGEVELEEVDDKRRAGMQVTVRDRGPGIPVEERQHVFDRFARTDQARTMPGSGLGLAIVRQVVEEHGGTVFVGDGPDGGAEVGFELPVS